MDGKKKRIVWIDDDINTPILSPYIDEFEENNFEVIKIESCENFLPILKIEAEKSLSAILVDIIMPPRQLDFRKTRGGLRTGLLVLEDILNDNSLIKIPIVVLTNGDDEEVTNYCMEKKIPYLKKKDYFTNELVNMILTLTNRYSKKTINV